MTIPLSGHAQSNLHEYIFKCRFLYFLHLKKSLLMLLTFRLYKQD